MSNGRDGFDAIGVVVEWIDACKRRRLDDLLNLYDPWATVDCCDGGRFQGRSEMERYWRPRLARASSCIRDRRTNDGPRWRDARLSRVRRPAGAGGFPLHKH